MEPSNSHQFDVSSSSPRPTFQEIPYNDNSQDTHLPSLYQNLFETTFEYKCLDGSSSQPKQTPEVLPFEETKFDVAIQTLMQEEKPVHSSSLEPEETLHETSFDDMQLNSSLSSYKHMILEKPYEDNIADGSSLTPEEMLQKKLNVFQENPEEILQGEPEERWQKKTEEMLLEEPEEMLQEQPEEMLQEKQENFLQEKPEEMLQEEPQEMLQEKPEEMFEEIPFGDNKFDEPIECLSSPQAIIKETIFDDKIPDATSNSDQKLPKTPLEGKIPDLTSSSLERKLLDTPREVKSPDITSSNLDHNLPESPVDVKGPNVTSSSLDQKLPETPVEVQIPDVTASSLDQKLPETPVEVQSPDVTSSSLDQKLLETSVEDRSPSSSLDQKLLEIPCEDTSFDMSSSSPKQMLIETPFEYRNPDVSSSSPRQKLLETSFEDWVEKKEMAYKDDTNGESGAGDTNSEEDIVRTETIEGEVELRIEVTDSEETLDDGTILRKEIITRRRIQPVTEIVVVDGVQTESRTIDEKIIDVEIEENILVLPFGVANPDESDELETSTSEEAFNELTPDGIPIRRMVITTTIHPSSKTIEKQAEEIVSHACDKALEEVRFSGKLQRRCTEKSFYFT